MIGFIGSIEFCLKLRTYLRKKAYCDKTCGFADTCYYIENGQVRACYISKSSTRGITKLINFKDIMNEL